MNTPDLVEEALFSLNPFVHVFTAQDLESATKKVTASYKRQIVKSKGPDEIESVNQWYKRELAKISALNMLCTKG